MTHDDDITPTTETHILSAKRLRDETLLSAVSSGVSSVKRNLIDDFDGGEENSMNPSVPSKGDSRFPDQD
jgi:hypothetical protein